MTRRQQVTSASERVIAVDPTRVWALLGDPARLGEWAGVKVVGYMGTELPKTGQAVFVQRRGLGARPRRVEIEAWEAGASIRCIIHGDAEPVRFDLAINPEVGSSGITTRVRLTQRSDVPEMLTGLAGWWTERRLARRLDRIEKVAKR